MFSSLLESVYRKLTSSRTVIGQAGTWTVVLFFTVAVLAFSPELAFVRAISPSSEYSRRCGKGYVGMPMEMSGELLCFPIDMVRKTDYDAFIPTVLAGLTVAGSVIFLRAVGRFGNGVYGVDGF